MDFFGELDRPLCHWLCECHTEETTTKIVSLNVGVGNRFEDGYITPAIGGLYVTILSGTAARTTTVNYAYAFRYQDISKSRAHQCQRHAST